MSHKQLRTLKEAAVLLRCLSNRMAALVGSNVFLQATDWATLWRRHLSDSTQRPPRRGAASQVAALHKWRVFLSCLMPGALSGGERPLLFSVLHQNSDLLFCTQAHQEEERHLFHLVTIATFLQHRVCSCKKLNPDPESGSRQGSGLHTRVLLIWW